MKNMFEKSKKEIMNKLKKTKLKFHYSQMVFAFAQWLGLACQRFVCQGTEPCHMQGPPIQNAVHVQRLVVHLAAGGFLLSPTPICLRASIRTIRYDCTRVWPTAAHTLICACARIRLLPSGGHAAPPLRNSAQLEQTARSSSNQGQ